jgi:hypothetical protein
MTFETILAMSLTTEAVVITALVLTLLNAFSEGYLVNFVSKLKWHPSTKAITATVGKDSADDEQRDFDFVWRHAA